MAFGFDIDLKLKYPDLGDKYLSTMELSRGAAQDQGPSASYEGRAVSKGKSQFDSRGV